MSVDDQRVGTFKQGSPEFKRRWSYMRHSLDGKGPRFEGICSGLVQIWTDIKLGELEDKSRLTPEQRLEQVDCATVMAIQIHGSDGPSGGLGQRDLGNRSLGLEETMQISPYEIATRKSGTPGPTWADVATHVKGGKKSCSHLVISLSKGDSSLGNHALGFYISSGKVLGFKRHVYFFDPNHGEYKIEPKDLAGWLGRFWTEKYQGCSISVLGLFGISRASKGRPTGRTLAAARKT